MYHIDVYKMVLVKKILLLAYPSQTLHETICDEKEKISNSIIIRLQPTALKL